jgi:hypothetical protein
MSYSIPVTALKSDLELSSGGGIERLPGRVNGTKSLTRNSNWQVEAGLSSNFSESVDLGIGYTANFNTARSNLRSSMDNSYYQGQLTGKLTLNGLKGWLLDNEVSWQQYVGLGAAYDRSALVWNASVGHKFLKGDVLEFRVSAFDILNRNVSVTRDVGGTYIQTAATDLLQRYIMFSLRFNLRAFKGRAERPPDGGDGD